jgi:hypothetical protein
MTRRAVAFLRELLQRAFAQIHTEHTWCDDGVFPPFTATRTKGTLSM